MKGNENNIFSLSNRRYIGSKAKLISFIQEVVNNNCTGITSILDIFGGTGIVGKSFNDKYKIIINDMLESNRIAYSTFLGKEPINTELIHEKIDMYNKKDCSNLNNYYSINFSNTYLSENNMKKVGYIRDDIDQLYADEIISSREKDVLVTSLIYAIDKIANTVGHYDAYRKGGDLDKELVLLYPEIDDTNNSNNEIYCELANNLVEKVSADLVYLDPPYNSRQYGDAYHFLENVATNKKPEVFGVAKKMDRSNLKSNYCTSKAPVEFENLIKKINSKYILVSYNNTGNKGNSRSNAKISDDQIVDVLSKRGKVLTFEQDFKLFTTGKTSRDNHKERLFLCHIGEFEKSSIDDNQDEKSVKSPLNYTGGKYRLLPQIVKYLPEDFDLFVDVFCGGANVGTNISCDEVICIDKNEKVIDLLNFIKSSDYYELVKNLEDYILYYNLSDTFLYGYDKYDCTSDNGVGKYNKDKFIKLRNDYNNLNKKEKKSKKGNALFLLLIIYSFNNQIRFNSKDEFNLPVGKRDLNSNLRNRLRLFINKISKKNIEFICKDFRQIDLEKLSKKNVFIYLDPPYTLGDATYNENGEWTVKDDEDLLAFLDKCTKLEIRFALSNVVEHKGEVNTNLIDWCIRNSYNINYLSYSYSNSNYHITNKKSKSKEVLITNYVK